MEKFKTFLLRCWYFPTFNDFYNDKYKDKYGIEDVWQLMCEIRLVLSTLLCTIIGLIIFEITNNLEVGIVIAGIILILSFYLWITDSKKQLDFLKQSKFGKQENTVIDDLAEIKKIAITILPKVNNEVQDQLLQIFLLVNKIEKQLYQKQIKESV